MIGEMATAATSDGLVYRATIGVLMAAAEQRPNESLAETVRQFEDFAALASSKVGGGSQTEALAAVLRSRTLTGRSVIDLQAVAPRAPMAAGSTLDAKKRSQGRFATARHKQSKTAWKN